MKKYLDKIGKNSKKASIKSVTTTKKNKVLIDFANLIKKNRTKIIYTYKLNIYSSDFNISIEQKKKMLELGYNEMKEHFSNLQCS